MRDRRYDGLSRIEARVFFKLSDAVGYLPHDEIAHDRRTAAHRISKLRSKGIKVRAIFGKPNKGGKLAIGYRLEQDASNAR